MKRSEEVERSASHVADPARDTAVPQRAQEGLYRLPYHWFPEKRLRRFEREERKRIVFDLISKHKVGRIRRYLDVGCGDGRWTADIVDFLSATYSERMEASGIDFSEQAISFARLIAPHVSFRVHRGERTPFPARSIDLVTSIEVIEHVEDAQEEQFVAELQRITKRDGLVILTTPSPNLKMVDRHFRHYSVTRLQELVSKMGFQVLEVRGQSVPYYGWLRRFRSEFATTPLIWRLWKSTYRETTPEESLDLFMALRVA